MVEQLIRNEQVVGSIPTTGSLSNPFRIGSSRGFGVPTRRWPDTQTDTQNEFLHAVFPNPERVPGALNHRGMAFASYYIAVQGRRIVSEGGYRTFSCAVGRYTTGPKGVYGRSPAMTVLPEIKMVNEMSKTVLRTGQKALDPPLLLQENGALSVSVRCTTSLDLGGTYFSTWRECHSIGVSSAERFARTSLSPANTLCR